MPEVVIVTDKFLKHKLRKNYMETSSSGIGNRIVFVVSKFIQYEAVSNLPRFVTWRGTVGTQT